MIADIVNSLLAVIMTGAVNGINFVDLLLFHQSPQIYTDLGS